MLRVETDALGPDERTQLEACIAVAEAEGGYGDLWRRLTLYTVLGFFLLAPILLGLSWFVGWRPSVALLLLGPAIGAAIALETHRRFEAPPRVAGPDPGFGSAPPRHLLRAP